MKTRECPRCWQPLEAERVAVTGPDVTVDACPQCQGMFLDKGEIRRLTGDRALNTLLTKHLGIDSDSRLVCPGCGGIMDAEDLDTGDGEDGSVVVDACLECNGVWLDDGELVALRESDADFSELSDAKRAELFDAQRVAGRQKRQRSALARLIGALTSGRGGRR